MADVKDVPLGAIGLLGGALGGYVITVVGVGITSWPRKWHGTRQADRLLETYAKFSAIEAKRWMINRAAVDSDDFKAVVQKVQAAYAQFSSTDPLTVALGDEPPSGYEQVFTPGSRVCLHQKGSLARDVVILQPTIWNDGKLMYQVEASVKEGTPPVRHWVPAAALEPSAVADAWQYAWWNRQTETYEEPEDDR